MDKLICIVGLTSSGKSSLGIELAKIFNGEIVSADSRQVYRGLDWCSGKVTKNEQEEVVHHLIDIQDLGNQFTLYDYQEMAYKAIDDILSKGKIPFLVGGTGLYSRAVVEGYNLVKNEPDLELRKELENLSLEELIERCKKENLVVGDEVNKRRLVRLLEKAGEIQLKNGPKYNVLQLGIKWERSEIYDRIKIRLENRMPNMIKEIEHLLAAGVSKDFLYTLGLEAKYVCWYLEGKFNSYEEFFEELFKEERHFAKRQQTWYNKEKNIIWLDAKGNLLENAKILIDKFLKNN